MFSNDFFLAQNLGLLTKIIIRAQKIWRSRILECILLHPNLTLCFICVVDHHSHEIKFDSVYYPWEWMTTTTTENLSVKDPIRFTSWLPFVYLISFHLSLPLHGFIPLIYTNHLVSPFSSMYFTVRLFIPTVGGSSSIVLEYADLTGAEKWHMQHYFSELGDWQKPKTEWAIYIQ